MFSPKALRDLIEGSGVSFTQNSISFKFTCPLCDKKEKLYIRKTDGRFCCWVCKETQGFQGKPEFALTKLLDLPVRQIQKILYGDDVSDNLHHYLPKPVWKDFWGENDEEFDVVVETPLPVGTCWPPDFVGPEDPAFVAGARYLHKRGITIEHVDTYQIKYDPPSNRVIFPFIIEGRLLGWQARYIGDLLRKNTVTGKEYRVPKSLTTLPRGIQGVHVMFQDRLKVSDHCILTEGPVDAIKAHLCGGNVASLGKGVSSQQIQTISKYVKKLYLGLDPDAGSDIRRIADEYGHLFDVYLLQPPRGREDLGDATPEEVYEAFMKAPRIKRGTLMVSLGDRLIY